LFTVLAVCPFLKQIEMMGCAQQEARPIKAFRREADAEFRCAQSTCDI
jgi:hypothetical protein